RLQRVDRLGRCEHVEQLAAPRVAKCLDPRAEMGMAFVIVVKKQHVIHGTDYLPGAELKLPHCRQRAAACGTGFLWTRHVQAAFNSAVISVRRSHLRPRRSRRGIARIVMRENVLAAVALTSLGLVSACAEKTDAEYRAEIAAEMHTSITGYLADLVLATRKLQV